MLILILVANPTYQKAKQYIIEVESTEHKDNHSHRSHSQSKEPKEKPSSHASGPSDSGKG